MATTPEGKVKQKVRDILDQYPCMYYYMPVPTGYGQTSLDFIGCYNGLFFAIETKAEGKTPTQRQLLTIDEIFNAKGHVLVIEGVDDPAFGILLLWLETHRPTSHDHPRVPPAQGRRRLL